MDIGIEISLYPLNANYIPPIQDFIDRLNAGARFKVITNSMSTQVFGSYDDIFNVLVREIRKTFEFFRSTTGTERVDRLVVSGGGSLLHGLTDALKHRFNTPVETVDPFRLLGDPPGHAGAVRDLHARTLGVAVGLALHRESRR